jgi:hypothetical protein
VVEDVLDVGKALVSIPSIMLKLEKDKNKGWSVLPNDFLKDSF